MTEAVRVLYFEDVQEGKELPSLKKDLDLPRLVAYAAATWDYIRVHYDAQYMQARGLRGPVVDGQMYGALLAQLVQDWAGPDAFLRKLSFRNRSMVFAGEYVTCYGVVAKKYTENDENLVELKLWVDNPKGEKAIEPASAVVRMPSRSS